MPLTNFPNGLSSFGVPVLGAGPLFTGKVFFVCSVNGANGFGRGQDTTTPLATIAYAIGLCTANKGDMIVVMPGHAEDIIAAGTITVNKAGVSIIGVGNGDLRPTLTFKTAVGATFLVSANNVHIENLKFLYTGIDAITTGLNITAQYCTVHRCQFAMADSTNQATVAVTLGASSDYTWINECAFHAPNAGATAAINSTVASYRVRITNCDFNGDFSTAAINNATNAWSNCKIDRCNFDIRGTGKAIVLVATATGYIRDCVIQIAANIAAGGSMTAAAALKANNLAQETAGIAASAVVDPAAVAIT